MDAVYGLLAAWAFGQLVWTIYVAIVAGSDYLKPGEGRAVLLLWLLWPILIPVKVIYRIWKAW